MLVTSGLVVALAAAPGSTATSGEPTVTEHVAQASPAHLPAGYRKDHQTGGLAVTVPVVGFAPGDGLPAGVSPGRTYLTTVLVVVGPGHEGATASITWDGAPVEGCRSVPLATGRATRLTCTVTADGRSTGRGADLVVTVRTLSDGWFRHTYVHA